MSVNSMGIEQAKTVLSAIVSQMQGGTLGSVSVGDFTTVANNMIRTGYDPFNQALTQVLARTIFSNRPYKGKLGKLQTTAEKYGAITRKVNFIDTALEDDQQLYKTGYTGYSDGDVPTPDQYAFRKPKMWQSNFYGAETFQKATTRYKNQIDTALTSAEMFGEFLSAQYQNVYDQLEQVHEGQRRQALINYIGGKSVLGTTDANGGHVIKLFTQYNADAGLTGADAISISNYLQPDKFVPFVKWLYATIETLVSYMGNRSPKYHYNPQIGGSVANIMRHTPKNRLKAYMNTSFFNQIQAGVLADIFHADKLKMVDYEAVDFWQTPTDPTALKAKIIVNDPSVNITSGTTYDLKEYTVTTGTAGTGETAISPILGVLFDEDALGMAIVDHWQMDTPINAATGHSNTFWHFTDKVWNDFTENGIVLALA
ncbi:MAG: hypothetical protein KBS70_05760 [Bacteroidales bacterium]|nr:hypothetical protein [Candidatus Colicola equi]